ncbi:hypothetical protein BKA57DRAFT_514817 [Linnemannia elongata]|nr:hypothetical protein BKA57DRAFT_514817 [Linnemannia elongata]
MQGVTNRAFLSFLILWFGRIGDTQVLKKPQKKVQMVIFSYCGRDFRPLFLVVRENGAAIDRQDRGFSMASVLSHVVAQKHHLPHISIVSIDPLVFTTPTYPLTQTPLRLVFTRLALPWHK